MGLFDFVKGIGNKIFSQEDEAPVKSNNISKRATPE